MKEKKTLVFVVDDNEYTLEQIKRTLHQALPCHVVGFTKASDCLASLRRNPDFILSDCNLSGKMYNCMNGEQLLFLIKEQRPDIPVIMYSSKKDTEMAARLIKKGALDFINSDNVPITTTFARRITERIKAELARMKVLHRDKIRMFALFGVCAAFIFSVFVLLKTAPGVLPHAIVIFISAIGLLIFLRKENDQPFTGKNTHAGS